MAPSRSRCVVSLAAAWLLSACAAGDLVIIPPEVENARAPEGKYQNVHAVYLYNVGYVHFHPYDIGNSYYPSYATTEYAKIKLLDRAATEGYHFGNIFISHVGDLLDIAATIEKPDGRKVELGKSDFMTTMVAKDIIPDITPPINAYRTVIVFPGLDAGDVISYRYTKRGGAPVWMFSKMDAPVLYSKFMMARPIQRSEIQPVIYDPVGLKPDYGDTTGMITGMMGYVGVSRQATFDVWEARDVPAVIAEEGMPEITDLGAAVYVWQGEKRWDWNTLGETYFKWFNHYGRPPAIAKELAEKAVAGVADPKEKARAIYHWVKHNLAIEAYEGLSYVPREIEISPVKIKQIVEEKTATPEQAANLMFLMLQSQGLDATVVLTSPADQVAPLEGVPDLYQFTHPLLALPDGTLLDTTNRLVGFGKIPWAFEGRKALFVKGGQVSFRDLPISAAAENKREITVTGAITVEGVAKVDARSVITGQMALAYRTWLTPLNPKDRESAVRSIATATADKAEMDDFAVLNLDDVDKPLEITISYHVPNHAQLMRDRMVVKASPFLHHVACPTMYTRTGRPYDVCPMPTAEKREHMLRYPFKWLDDMSVTVTFPQNILLQSLPKGFRTESLESGSLGLQTSYASQGGAALQAVRKYSVNQISVDQAGYPKLKDMNVRYLSQKDVILTLDIPK